MLPSPAWTIRNATIFPRACCYDITRADVLRCGGGTESSGGERSQTCLTPDFFEPTVDAWGRTSDSDGGPCALGGVGGGPRRSSSTCPRRRCCRPGQSRAALGGAQRSGCCPCLG